MENTMDTIVNEEQVIDAQDPEETVVAPDAPKPGEKTDPALLLSSLKEVRSENKELKSKLAELESRATPPEGAFSEEGKLLEQQIVSLRARLEQKEEAERLLAIENKYPALRDKSEEFELFRSLPENAGLKIETAAKAFVLENNLLETPTSRRGLEKETGGVRAPQKQGRTPEEVDELMRTNFRQYSKELRAGTLYTG